MSAHLLVCLCTMCVVPSEASYSWTAVSCYVGLGTKHRPSARAASAFNQ